MSKSHTPGPWRADFLYPSPNVPDNARVVIHAPARSDFHTGLKVAEAEFAHMDTGYHVHDRREAEANARLIAAAPDLLQALIDLCKSNDEAAHPQWKGSPDEITARIAIAKARGEL